VSSVAAGLSVPHREIENLLRDLGHAGQQAPTPGQHDSRIQGLIEPGPPDLFTNQREDFLGPGLQDLGHHLQG
jgi:hypothetical protein